MGFFDFFRNIVSSTNKSSSNKSSSPILTIDELKELLADVEKEIYNHYEEVSRDVWHFFWRNTSFLQC